MSFEAFSSSDSWFYRAIRIFPHEVPRTAVVWAFRFLYRFALVVLWTYIVSMVADMGAPPLLLAFLFLGHAFFVFLGSFLTLRLFRYVDLDHLFIGYIAGSVLLLLIAQGFNVFFVAPLLSLLSVLFVESFFLVQISIHIETFTERLFTPLESQRTFPVVESADTISVIFAGLLLAFGGSFLTLYRISWLVIAFLMLLFPLLLSYHQAVRFVPGVRLFRDEILAKKPHSHRFFSTIMRQPFFVTLGILVLCQWFFSVSLEYLYTTSIATHSFGLSTLTGNATENTLVETFGFLQILFGGLALVTQLFVAGRFLSGHGIAQSILFHPLVALFSLAAMIAKFSPFTTILARANSEVTGVVFRNAYQSSYYVFQEEESQYARNFLDGVVRPLGTLFGTFFLTLSLFLTRWTYSQTVIFFGIFVVLLFFFLAASAVQKRYTSVALEQVMDPETDPDHVISLLEVLSQRGHGTTASFLVRLFERPGVSSVVRCALLRLLSRDDAHFSIVFSAVSDTEPDIRSAALASLVSLYQSGYFQRHPYSRSATFQTLRDRLIVEQDESNRLSVLRTLSLFEEELSSSVLFEMCDQFPRSLLGPFLYDMRFRLDPLQLTDIRTYLLSDDIRVWPYMILILYSHDAYRSEALRRLSDLEHLPSPYARRMWATIHVLLPDLSNPRLLHERLTVSSDVLERALLFAGLLIRGDETALHPFASSLVDHGSSMFLLARPILDALPVAYVHGADRFLQQQIFHRLHALMHHQHDMSFSRFSDEELRFLHDAYTLLHVPEGILRVRHEGLKRSISFSAPPPSSSFLPLWFSHIAP